MHPRTRKRNSDEARQHALNDSRDAARYRFLMSELIWELGGHTGPGNLSDATSSEWALRSPYIFMSNNGNPPSDKHEALDCAIEKWDDENLHGGFHCVGDFD